MSEKVTTREAFASKNALNNDHLVLPAMPKGSTQNLLGPIFVNYIPMLNLQFGNLCFTKLLYLPNRVEVELGCDNKFFEVFTEFFLFQPFDFNIKSTQLWFNQVPVPIEMRPEDAQQDLRAPQMVIWLVETMEVKELNFGLGEVLALPYINY